LLYLSGSDAVGSVSWKTMRWLNLGGGPWGTQYELSARCWPSKVGRSGFRTSSPRHWN